MENSSLLKSFEPPEGFVGQTCVCCALSADQSFMEEAVRRFTNRRIFDGAVSVYLMLDKTGELLDTQAIKGLVQLQAVPDDKICIQHAKVALMQFAKKNRQVSGLKLASDTMWRLVVSTGNWTVQSACKNIEMIWKADLYAGAIDRQLFSDIYCATDFLKKLRKHYICNDVLWKRAEQMFGCIEECKDKWNIKNLRKPRFIATIGGTPLFNGIKDLLESDKVKRNFIQIGSGFYEQEDDSDAVSSEDSTPVVVKELDKFLKNNDFFSKRLVGKHIIVNKESAGKLASWDKSDRNGWKLFDIKDPVRIKDEDMRRSFMHAKYICLGHLEGKIYSGCKFYIGSGNLSIKGIMSAYGKSVGRKAGAGNIEAGVVVDVDEATSTILLTHGNEIKNSGCLNSGKNEDLDNGDKSVDVAPICPIEGFRKSGLELVPIWISDRSLLEDEKSNCLVITDDGTTELELFSKKCLVNPDCSPVSIAVKWLEHDYWVPVLGENGLLQPAKVEVNGIDQALSILVQFPDIEDDDAPDEDGENGRVKGHHVGFHDEEIKTKYPIQDAVKFVEGVAKCNEAIKGSALDDWIYTLNRVIEALPKSEIERLKSVGINFLSVLTANGFAPAEGDRTYWNGFVREWSRKWGLDKLPTLRR